MKGQKRRTKITKERNQPPNNTERNFPSHLNSNLSSCV